MIHLNGEAETKENFEPDPVQLMVDLSLLRDLGDPAFAEKPTVPDLQRWSKSEYYLDVADLDPKTHSIDDYKTTYETVKGSYPPTVYARVKEGSDYTIVQYWLFYYFNDWRNFHEGDWELVQLNFPNHTINELLENKESPLFAAYSQHQAGQKMSWSDMQDKGLVTGTHPVVYVAKGSHANYFTPGQFWSGLDFDDTGLSSWRVIFPEQLDIVLLPEAESEGLEWLRFQGYWGEYLGFSVSVLGLKFWQRGPSGPQWGEGGDTSRKWEHPEEWAGGLPEYPKPFWTSFLSLPGDWSKLAIFSIFSPAEIHVYDAQGRHVGLDEEGKLEKEAPGAMYITPEGTDYKTILIPNADVTDEYRIEVKGTDSGIMELKAKVPDAMTKLKRFLEYKDVPILATTRARVEISSFIPMPMLAEFETVGETMRDTVTKLELDSDGDGIFELESTPGNFESQKVVPSLLQASIDIEPEILDPASLDPEKPIAVFIELPVGYNAKNIDVSTVYLVDVIRALERPIEVVDRDRDGIYELMVQFDSQMVMDYIETKGQAESTVDLILTGVIDGRPFEGRVLVIRTQ